MKERLKNFLLMIRIRHYMKNFLVFIITMKYGLNVESGGDGDPVEVLLNDKVLTVLCILYFIIMFVILYVL